MGETGAMYEKINYINLKNVAFNITYMEAPFLTFSNKVKKCLWIGFCLSVCAHFNSLKFSLDALKIT